MNSKPWDILEAAVLVDFGFIMGATIQTKVK